MSFRSSRKGKNDPEGDSEIIRALIPTTGPGSKAISSLVSKGRAKMVEPLLRAVCVCVCGGGCCPRSGPGGQSIKPERIILEP